MKHIIILILLALSSSVSAQCYKVDSVVNHATIKEVAGRPVTFGVQATFEQLVSDKYSLCDSGALVELTINTVGMPEQLVNIVGLQFLKRTYTVNISTKVNNITHYSSASKTVYVNAMFVTVESIPHNKKAFSKAIQSCLVDLAKKL